MRLHVAAKRYLCAVEPGYLAALSPASVYTLKVQGGPMNAAERAEFEANPQAGAALRLRRWDDEAKDPAASPPAFGYYKPLLRRLLRPRPPSAHDGQRRGNPVVVAVHAGKATACVQGAGGEVALLHLQEDPARPLPGRFPGQRCWS